MLSYISPAVKTDFSTIECVISPRSTDGTVRSDIERGFLSVLVLYLFPLHSSTTHRSYLYR